MFLPSIRAAAPLLLLFASPISAQPSEPITAADIRRHIQFLASDEFQGRMPATEGETLTTNYIVQQFQRRGLEPAGENGSWLQPVALIERAAQSHEARWMASGRTLQFRQDEIVLLGRNEAEHVADAPVIFAGHGAQMPDRGIDQLAGVDLHGAIVLIMLEAPDVAGFPSLSERSLAVSQAGAAAVIAIVGPDLPWDQVRSYLSGRAATRLESTSVPPITGTMPLASAQRLIEAGGGDMGQLLNAQPGSSFRAVTLPLRGSIDVATSVRRFGSHNVVGRLRGNGSTNEAVLFLSHWDHLGICRPEGAEDRICNGAVDNASGVASLIEIAGHLSRPRLARDVLFLATTAEEMGMLGAEYFAAHPPVTADRIVAAVNMDSVAIHPAGLPVAMIGRGISPSLDRVVDATIQAAGRQVDSDDEANVMVQRQDGWKLNQAGIPTVMVSGSFSDMSVLQAFLDPDTGTYHQPSDDAKGALEMGGAVEDANLMVALARQLADPAVYQRDGN